MRAVRPSILLAVVAALLLTAFFAVSELATLRGAKAHDAPAFLTRALGSPLNSARLVRKPEPGVKVTLGHSTGLTVQNRKHGHVTLTTHGAGDAGWRHYTNGATRSTPFGHETITLAPGQAEQYLTVTRRQGTKTWRWDLGTNLNPRLRHNGLIDFYERGSSTPAFEIMPVTIADADGTSVTPAGTAWKIARHGRSLSLELTLDDSKLPLPYVIDPAIVFDAVSGNGVAGTNTITWNHTVAVQTNRMLLVSYNAENTTTTNCHPTSVTYNGVAMTLAGQVLADTPSPNWDCVGIYYLLAPATGTHAISMTFGSAPVNDSISGAAMSIYSVAQKAPDAVATSDAAGLTSTNITTLWPNSWVVDAMGPGDLSGNLAPNAAQTVRRIQDSTGSNSIGMSSKLVAAAGSTNMSWTRTPAPNRTGQVVVALSQLDNTNPSAPAITVSESSPLSYVNGTTLYYNAQGANTASFTVDATSSDADSGIQKINFPAIAAMTGGGDDLTSPYQGAYTWNPATVASGAQTVTVTNGQGLTSTGTFTVTRDATNPTGNLTAPASSAIVRGNSVAVSSNSADAGSGVAQALFQRSPTGANTWTDIGTADTTSPYSVNWDTTAVADGLYDLRVVTTDNVNNSFTSALVTSVRVDNTLPTNSLSLQSVAPAGSAFLTGTTVYYRGTPAGSFQLQNSVTDTGSGPATSVFPALGGTVGGWTHTAQTVNTPAGGPYVTTNNFAWPAGATQSPTESVTSTDTAGNTSTATVLTFTNDTTVPSGSVTAPASSANVSGSSVSVTSNSADGGSGVASALFQRSPAGANTWTDIGAADTTSPYSVNWDTTAVADGLYDLRVITTDNVGNTFTSALVTNVRVDNTVPTNALAPQSASPAGSIFQSGSTIYYRGAAAGSLQLQNTVSDAGSGPASSIFPVLGGTVGGWTHTSQTVNTPAGGPYVTTNNFAWPAGETASPTQSVTSTDAAGNTSTATVLTFTNDSTAPTGAITAPAASANVRGAAVTVSSNSADGGSGVANAQFQRSPAGAGTWTNIGAADTSSPYSVSWDTTAVADGLYDLRVITTDNVGNTVTSALVTNVRVDNTVPTNALAPQSVSPAGSVFQSGLTIYYRGAAAGSLQLQNAVSDAGSGPASSVFPALGGTVGSWTHTTQTVNTPTGGPYVTTNSFAWGAGEAASPTEPVTSTDNAGNTSAATVLTFTNDSTNPTGAITGPASNANVRGSSVSVNSNSADGGSGVANAQFQRSPAGAGTWTNIGAADTSSPYAVNWDTTAVADGVYDLRVITTDNVGNAFTSALVTNVRVDNTLPTNSLSLQSVAPAGSTFQNGATVYYRGAAPGSFQLQNAVTDAGSAPASSVFPALGGTVGSWTHTTQTVNTPAGGPYVTTNTFAWGAGETNSPTESVTSTDNAGNTSNASVLTFTNDSTAPTGSVTAPSAGGNVNGASVSVTSNSADGGSSVASAQFQRSPAGAGTWTTIGAADTTSPYAVAWDTTAVADGLYDLRVITTDNVGNTFTSAAVVNVRVDNTLPTNALSVQSNSPAGSAFQSGTTVYYRGSAAGSLQLQNTVSDAGSGPASSTFPALGGTVGGWTHTSQTVNAPAGGPYVTSNSFAWPAGETASPTESVTSQDTVGNTSNATVLTFTNDSTNPTGALTAPASSANVRGSAVAVSSNSADGGSGVANAQFQRSPAGAGTWTNIGAADTSSPYAVNWDTTAVADGLYDLRVITTDNVGNSFTSALVTNVRVDNTLPTNALSAQSNSPAGSAFQSGTTLYYRGSAAGSFQLQNTVSDAGSAPASSVFPALGGTVGGWTHTGQTINTPAGGPFVTTNSFAWPAGETASPTESVTSTDNAGNTSSATVLTFTNDSTAPTGSITAPVSSANVNGLSVAVTSNSADGGSGVVNAQFQRSPAGAGTWTNIGAADTSSPYAVNWDTTAVADGLYDLRVITTDNVGNTFTSALVTNVRVDNSLPTNSLSLQSVSPAGSAFLNAGTVYYRGAAAGTLQLQNAVSDVGSGPASSVFPVLGGVAGGWTHTGQTVNAPAGGPYVTTNNFAWPAGETASPTESVTSTDNTGNTSAPTVLTFTNDSTGPSGTVTAPAAAANVRGSSVAVSSGDAADGGSGVASVQFQRSPAGAGTWTNIGAADTSSPYSVNWDTTAVADGLYDLRAVIADNVGNSTTTATVANVRVDNTLPTNALSLQSISPAGAAFQNGATVYYRGAAAGSLQLRNTVSDAGSGPASATFPALGGTVGTWTHTAQTVNTPAGGPYTTTNTFAWNAGETNSPTESVTSQDAAGNTSGASVLTLTNDSTNPTGSITGPAASSSVRGSAVAVSSNSADGGSGVASAQFQRSPAGAGTWTNIGAADTTSPYSVNWDTTAVTDGLYELRVITTDNVGNSFTSALVTNVLVDNTLPANALSLQSVSPAGSAFQSGTTVYYRGAAAGSLQLQNAVSDAGSGPASSVFPALGGTAGSWAHTTQTLNTPAGGPYVTTNNFAWSAGETNNPTESVTSTDNAGNTSNATVLAFTNDSTAPTGSVTAPAASANVRGSSVAVTSNSADGGSGVASAQFQRSPAGAGTWTNIGAADTSSPYSVNWDTTAVADGLYDLRVTTTDNVGNSFTSAAVVNVRVDNTLPTNALSVQSVSPAGSVFQNGATVYYRGAAAGSFQLQDIVSDAGSGPASSTFPALGGTAGSWTHTGQTVSTPAGGPYVSTNNFAWSAGETNSPTESVTSQDVADNTSNASVLTFTNDSTAPTGSITAPASSANVNGSSVSVTSNSADGGSGVASAQFQRSPAGAGTWTNIGAADTSSPYSTSWDTTAIADGLYDLRVITTDNVGNTFTSTLVTNVRVDNGLPTNSLSLQSVSPVGSAFLNAGTVYYRGAAAGNLQLQNTVSDSGSGPASSTFPVLGGTVGSWTHTGQTVNTPAVGPYVTSNSFAWPAGETASPTESVTSQDTVGNTSNASVLTFTNDSTAPSVTAPSVTAAYYTALSVPVTVNGGSDSGSGLAPGSSVVQRDVATLSGGTCSGWSGTWTTVTLTGGNDTTVLNGRCYQYREQLTDRVGNVGSSVAGAIAMVDNNAPSNSLSLSSVSPAGSALKNGTTVYYRGSVVGGGSFRITNSVSDGESGPASSHTAALAGGSAGWTHTPSTVSTPAGGPFDSNTFSWAQGSTSSPTATLTGADVAGNTQAAAAFTFTNDSTAPAGGALSVNGTAANSGGSSSYDQDGTFTIGLRTDWTENQTATESGLASSTLVRTTASYTSADTCGSFGSATTLVGTPAQNGLTTGCYRYTLTGTDNVGNTTTITTTVKVDTSDPAAPSLSFSAVGGGAYYPGSGGRVYFKPDAANGTFDISASSTDADTGIASYSFPAGSALGTNWASSGSGSSRTYSYTATATSNGSQNVTATNNAGRSANSSFTPTADSTAPAGGALSVNGTAANSGGSSSYDQDGTFTIGLRTDWTENQTATESGLASSTLVRTTASYTSADTCGSFGSATTLVGTPAQNGLTTGCYRYTLTGTDNVGNTTTITTTVKVDTSDPAAPSLSFSAVGGGAYYPGSGGRVYFKPDAANGTFDISASSTDADTGIASYSFPAGSALGTNWASSGSGSSRTYSYTATATSNGSQNVTATNNAGRSANSSFTPTADSTAPAGGALSVNGTAANSGGSSSYDQDGTFTIGLRTDWTENQTATESGLASSTLVRTTASYTSADTCGSFGSATTLVGTPAQNGLTTGCYRYTLTGTDNVGNTTTITTTVKVDTDAPTVSLNDPGTPVAGTISVAASASDSSTGVQQVVFQRSPAGAGTWTTIGSADTTAPYGVSWDTTAIADGLYDLRAVATDTAGNSDTSVVANRRVDNTAPVTSLDSGPGNPDNDTTPTFTFSSNEPGSAFECRVDGGSWTACTSPFTVSPALSAGSHSLDVRATDTAGNTDATPASETWTIDLTAPATSIDSTPAHPSNDTTPTFTFSSDKPGSTFACRIDGGSWTACTTPFTVAPALGAGSHTFDVRATDLGGNTDPTPASDTWTIDLAAPITSLDTGPAHPSNDTTPTFTFSSNEPGSTFECRIDGASWTTCTSPFTSPALGAGSHTFDVRATDPAGNTDATPASDTWTIDLTAPVTSIDSTPAHPSNDATPTFTFSSNEPGSTFECRIDGGSWTTCTSPFTSPALGAGSHTFDVRATDPAGNTDATPASDTWTIDLTAPVTSIDTGPADPDNDTTPTFTFSSNEPGSTFECRIDGGSWTTCPSPFTVSPALFDGAHVVDVRATDPAGNTDATPSSFTWTLDTGAPTVTLTSPTTYINASNPTSYPVNASTPDGDVTRVDFFECSNASAACSTGSWIPFGTDNASPYSALWSTPAFDGPKAIRAVAYDIASNNGEDVRTITIDRTAPSGVTVGYPNGYVSGSFAITTNNGPDSDVDGSSGLLERQVGDLANDSCSSYGGFAPASSPDTLPSGKCARYRYSVADNAGNVAVATSPNEAKSDMDAPTSAQGDPGANLRQTVVLTSSASDTGGSTVASVAFQRRPAGGGPWTTIGADTTAPYSFSFDTTTIADGLYDLRSVATDKAGNDETSPVVVANRRIDNTAPSATMLSPGNPVSGAVTLTSTTNDGGSGIASISYELAPNGGSFNSQPTSWDTTLNADGLYDLRVTATDVAGNSTTSVLVTTRVDNTAPALTFSSPANNAAVSGTVNLVASASDASPASPPVSFAYKLHSDPPSSYASAGASWNTTTLPAGDGLYDLRAQATDAAGNTRTIEHTNIRVDNVAPIVAITAPTTAINGSVPSPTPFSANATDPGGSGIAQVDFFRCSDQSINCATGVWNPLGTIAAPGPYSVSWNIPGTDGNRSLAVVATDNAGHPSSAIRNVDVDRTSPQTTIGTKPADPSNAATPNFSFSSNEPGSTFECSVDGGAFGACTSPDALSGLTDGAHTFSVRATDPAGNTDPTPDSWTWHRDTTDPTATLNNPGANIRQTVTLSSTENDPASGGYASGLTSVAYEYSANGMTWAPIGTLSSAPFDSIPWNTTVVTDGVYQLRIVVTDVAGNVKTSAAVTNVRIDNTVPTTSQNDPGQYLRATKPLTGTAADSGSGIDHVDFERAAAGSGSWSLVATDSNPGDGIGVSFDTTTVADGHYDFRTVAYDVAGNQASSTPVNDRLVDNTVPNATLNDPGAYLRASVNLTSSTSDPGGANASAIASVAYEYSTNGGGTWQPTGSTFDSTSVADGNVQLRVVATDNAGNSTASSALTKLVDNTKPATTDNAPSGWQSSPVTVTFSASDAGSGINVTEYSVDGNPSYTAGNSVVIPAPSNGSNDGVHTIAYFSVDNAGNIETVKSTTVMIDATPPACPGCAAADYLRGTVTLSASPDPDGSGIASVEFEYTTAGGSTWTSIGTDTTGPAPYTTNWDTTSVADGHYDLRIKITDNAGNVTTTDLADKVVDNTAPNADVGSPTEGLVLGGTVSILPTASDATSPLKLVEFYVRGSLLGTDSTAPYSMNWDSTSGADGPATLVVVVEDMAGNRTTSSTRNIVIDNGAPTLSFTSPVNNAVVNGSVNLVATSSDPIAFAYKLHSDPVSAYAPVSSPWDTTALADGLYDLRATSTDSANNTTTVEHTNIRVDNTLPSGSISSPGAGATVGGSSVSLSGSYSDGGSGVASVSYEIRPTSGGSFTQIANATSAPFGATWDATTFATGSYDMRPVITDHAGNVFTGPVVTFNVNVSAPTVTLTNPGATISGTVTLNATVTGSGATQVAFAATPTGGATWTTIGTDTSSPWSTSFNTTTLPDGVYDLRATVTDTLSNTSSDVVTGIRIDNTVPRIVSQTPLEGATVTSASSIAFVTTEPVTLVGVTLDGGATVAPIVTGTNVTYNTGALSVGPHTLAGELQDSAGKKTPFRIHFTVWAGSSGMGPYVEKNTTDTASTTLESSDGLSSVTMPSGDWSSPSDWLVLKLAPMAPPSGLTNGFGPGPEILDVTARWALANGLVHTFNHPLNILMRSTDGSLVPATFENGRWRSIARVPTAGVLPGGWADGFYRDSSGVHILTKHLSQFGLLRDVEAPNAPENVRGYLGSDGLTIRWIAGNDNSGTYDYVTVFSGSNDIGHYGVDFITAGIGPWTPTDTRVFRLKETDLAGNQSELTRALLPVPSLIGLTVEQAAAILTSHGFQLGTVSGGTNGIITGPENLVLAEEGAVIDVTVQPGGGTDALGFKVHAAPRFKPVPRKRIAARVSITRAARVTAELFSPRRVKLFTWRFAGKAGSSIVKLRMPRQVQRTGVYSIRWTAKAGRDVAQQRITIRLVGKRAPVLHGPWFHVPGRARSSWRPVVTPKRAAVTTNGRVLWAKSVEETYDTASSPGANVRVIVIDIDQFGLSFVRDLHSVYPSVRIVALTSRPKMLAAAVRAGAAIALPRSTSEPVLARVINKLLQQPSA